MVESIGIASGLDKSGSKESKLVLRFLVCTNKLMIVPISGDLENCGRMISGR